MAGTLTALPPLREDLQVIRTGPSYSGAPVWVVFDPLANRFFKIGYELCQLLSFWNECPSRAALAEAVGAAFARQASDEEIGAAEMLLDRNSLLAEPKAGGWRGMHARATAKKPWHIRMAHAYLFFRVPLFNPTRFIAFTWPLASLFFTRGFACAALAAAVLGLYIVSRQWDAFVSTFPYFFTFAGALAAVAAIILTKSAHELGHAYAARLYGCRVSAIGIAMMVLTPMPYADISDLWRLSSRRQRIVIDLAGVMAELSLGAFALLLWGFLPDGPFRSATFLLAAASWIASVAINLNPLMRFDGYYILADLWGIENLQARALAQMRWRLREWLFDLEEPAPEPFSRGSRTGLIIYAAAMLAYRLLLYAGLALLVYAFFIKIVGVALFLIEIIFFILAPLYLELKVWWTMRNTILKRRRTYLSAAIFSLGLLLLFMPYARPISAPAMLITEEYSRIFPQEEAIVEKMLVRNGQNVHAGEPLAALSSPAMVQEKAEVEIRMALAEARLARIGSDGTDLAEAGVTRRQLAELIDRKAGISRREQNLSPRAPFDGTVRDIEPSLVNGQWVQRSQHLMSLTGGAAASARGYLAGDDLMFIAAEGAATFIPDDPALSPVSAGDAAVSLAAAQWIELPELASDHGGPVAATKGENGAYTPLGAWYAIHAAVLDAHPRQSQRGVLKLTGRKRSLASRAWRQVLRVLVRESGA